MRKSAVPCLVGLFVGGLCAAPVQTIAPNAVVDKFRTLAPENERLAGLLATRIRANTEGLLEHIDVPVLLAAYSKPGGMGNGELAGRYLQASAHAYEYRQDSELRKVMDRVVEGLAKTQRPDGYLGTAAADERFGPADLRVHRANLLGLLAYYQATGEEAAYTVSQKIGDLLVEKLKGKELDDTAAATGISEPLIVLYRYTAEPAYVELAKRAAKAKDVSGWDAADRITYYISLAELYRVSGDEISLRDALAGWASVAAGEKLSVTGVPSLSDSGRATNCVTAAWLRLNLELMRLTGLPKYGNNLEKTIYNHLLAGQDIRSGDVCATTPGSGKKGFLPRAQASASPCALAEADGIAIISQTLWGRWGNGVAINLYNPGRGSFQLRRRALIQIYVESSFPEHGDILLHVEPSRNARFPLRLRVPEWAENFTVDFGGSSHLIGKAGEYLLIEREWKRGDTVKIVIGMRAQTVTSGPEEGKIALKRGAELLVVNRALNPQIKDLSRVVPIISEGGLPALISLENKLPRFWAGEEGYQMKCQYEGKAQTVTVVPFADAMEFAMWLDKGNGS